MERWGKNLILLIACIISNEAIVNYLKILMPDRLDHSSHVVCCLVYELSAIIIPRRHVIFHKYCKKYLISWYWFCFCSLFAPMVCVNLFNESPCMKIQNTWEWRSSASTLFAEFVLSGRDALSGQVSRWAKCSFWHRFLPTTEINGGLPSTASSNTRTPIWRPAPCKKTTLRSLVVACFDISLAFLYLCLCLLSLPLLWQESTW